MFQAKELEPYSSHGHELIKFHPKSTSSGQLLNVKKSKSCKALKQHDSRSLKTQQSKGLQGSYKQQGSLKQQDSKGQRTKRERRRGLAHGREGAGLDLFTAHLSQQLQQTEKKLQVRKNSLEAEKKARSSGRLLPIEVASDDGEADDDDDSTQKAPRRMTFEDDGVRFLCESFAFASLSPWRGRCERWCCLESLGSLMMATKRKKRKARVVRLETGCAPAAARLLRLTEPMLRHLYWVFHKVDCDGSGTISTEEFLDIIDTEDTDFVRVFIDHVVFDMADLDTDNQLNFSEFLIAATAICTLSRKELLFFLFRIFDTDQSGAVEHKEFAKLAQAVSDMGSLFPGNYGTFFAAFDDNNDGEIDFAEFLAINDRFPMLFFPATRIQDNFRRATFTPAFWAGLSRSFSEANNGDRFHRRIAEIGRQVRWVDGGPPPKMMGDDMAKFGGSFGPATKTIKKTEEEEEEY